MFYQFLNVLVSTRAAQLDELNAQYPGRYEPLVSPELWQEVQDVLAAQGAAGEKQRLHNHYLNGVQHIQQAIGEAWLLLGLWLGQ